MNSEARITRSAMRTRACRGLTGPNVLRSLTICAQDRVIADELLELPVKSTPSRARSTMKTRLPFDELSNAKAPAEQAASTAKTQALSRPEIECQTPAVKGSSGLSDVERMLLSPMPRLTPEPTAKAADEKHVVKAAAPVAEAEDQAAESAIEAKAAAAAAAAQQATVDAHNAEQSAAIAVADAKAAPGAHAAKLAAEVQAAVDAAAAQALQQAADERAAANAEAAAQAQLAEDAHAAKVAAEVQAAADAALAEALRQAAEAQAAAEAAPADAPEPEAPKAAPSALVSQTSSDEASDRWDIDGADTVGFQLAVGAAPAPSAIKSKVVAAASFDSRSIRQLKKEIKDQYAKQAVITYDADSADEQEEEGVPSHVAATLSDALGGLSISNDSMAVAPLRGVPVAEGRHMRFDDETGEGLEASPMHMPLRGVPPREGVHLRFDD